MIRRPFDFPLTKEEIAVKQAEFEAKFGPPKFQHFLLGIFGLPFIFGCFVLACYML